MAEGRHHPGQGRRPDYLWCLVRRWLPGPSGRKRYNVLAALDAVTRRVVRVTNGGTINAHSVCQLLQRIAAAGLPGPITLVMDNARYQRCRLVQDLAGTLGIELLFLPSYSPNLNLIERLWKFVKAECLAARRLESYEEFTAAIDACLNDLPTIHKAKMDSLLTLNFQSFEVELDLMVGSITTESPGDDTVAGVTGESCNGP